MLAKKVTALLVSAALVLALLAGCGNGSKALSQVMADLLSGLYTNVDVEVDSDLTAALKKAAAEGGTEEEILTRLVNNLNLSGVSISFNCLDDGQQGEHGVDLVFQAGSDPDAAARNALAQWAGIFGSLPDDGSYRASVAMIEAENGYYIAVDVEVLKAGSRGDESTPVFLKSIEVAHGPDTTNYTVGQKFDPTGMVITATYSNGDTKTIENITSENSQGVKWTPDGALTEGTYDITISYDGQTTKVSVTVEVEKIEIEDLYVSSRYVTLSSEEVQSLYDFIEGEATKYPSIQMGTNLDIQKALQSIAKNDSSFTAFNNGWSNRVSTYKQTFGISEDDACILLFASDQQEAFKSTNTNSTLYYGFYGVQSMDSRATNEELLTSLKTLIEDRAFNDRFSKLTLDADADPGYTNTYELYVLINDCKSWGSTGLSANFLLLRTRTPAT